MAKKTDFINLHTQKEATRVVAALINRGIHFQVKHLDTVNYWQVSFPNNPTAKVAVKNALDEALTDEAGTMHKEVLSLSLSLGFGDPGKPTLTENVRAVCARFKEEYQNVKGPFERVTTLAAGLAHDLNWAREMWGLDRTGLLENAKYWKGVAERLVEKRVLEAHDGKVSTSYPRVFPEMRRPSERDLADEAREATLKSVADAVRRGEVAFEPSEEVPEGRWEARTSGTGEQFKVRAEYNKEPIAQMKAVVRKDKLKDE